SRLRRFMYECDFHPAKRASSRADTPCCSMSSFSSSRSLSSIHISGSSKWVFGVCVTVRSFRSWCPAVSYIVSLRCPPVKGHPGAVCAGGDSYAGEIQIVSVSTRPTGPVSGLFAAAVQNEDSFPMTNRQPGHLWAIVQEWMDSIPYPPSQRRL